MENQNTELVSSLARRLVAAKFWMQLTAVLSIIYGILTALSIVGIIVAWLPIWMGVLLFQSAAAVDDAQSSGDQEALGRCLDKLKVYFIIIGVGGLVGIAFMVLSLLIGGIGAMSAVGGGGV